MRLQESQLHHTEPQKQESPLSRALRQIGKRIGLLTAGASAQVSEQLVDLTDSNLQLAIPIEASARTVIELRTEFEVLLRAKEQLVKAQQDLEVRDRTLEQICSVMESYSREGTPEIGFIESLGNDVKYALFHEHKQVFNKGFTEQALVVGIRGISSTQSRSTRVLNGELFAFSYEPYQLLVETTRPLAEPLKHLMQLYVREKGHSERAERARLSEERVTQMEWLANHDPLTGLANRRLLTQVAEKLITADMSNTDAHAAIHMDLDGFKLVNDTYGHAVGDNLLEQVAVRVNKVCQQQDLISRIGGDEFVILRPYSQTDSGVYSLAEQLIEAISMPTIINGQICTVSVSIGIAWWRYGDEKNVDEWMHEADTALYESKNSGKACYRAA